MPVTAALPDSTVFDCEALSKPYLSPVHLCELGHNHPYIKQLQPKYFEPAGISKFNSLSCPGISANVPVQTASFAS